MTSFLRQTLTKSGLVLQHWPNLPVGKFGLKRGIVDTRTATASTNPFSVCNQRKKKLMILGNQVT